MSCIPPPPRELVLGLCFMPLELDPQCSAVLCRSRVQCTGLLRNGREVLQWIGSHWVALGRFIVDWIALDCIGLHLSPHTTLSAWSFATQLFPQ